MKLSNDLVSQFVKITRKEEKSRDQTVYGTIVEENGEVLVRIDGADILTPVSGVVDAKNGDRVMVSIANHSATVLGNFTFKPSARDTIKAQQTADSASAAAIAASQSAQNAVFNAGEAIQFATQAKDAATNALSNAQEAKTAAGEAKNSAELALGNASQATETANQANEKSTAAQESVKTIKSDVEAAEKEIEELAESLETYSNEMTANYARKTDLSSVEASLGTRISQNAAQLESTATRITEVEADFSEQAQEAKAQAQSAQELANTAKQQADTAKANAQTAQNAADVAAQAASNAQELANTAQTAANNAQSKADKAAQDLVKAEENLANVTSRVGVTEEEIEAAQAEVDKAKKAASDAQTSADNANSAAIKAQTDANTAKTNAQNAQTAADKAQADATTAIANAKTAQDAVDSLGKRVEKAETDILQNSNAIALRATKEELTAIANRVSTAEQKITAEAIVTTVRSSTSYKSDLNGKVGTSEVISCINQTAETIKIQASKINLVGAVTAECIAAGAVTADKISVNSLEAIVAKIGGFTIGPSALYNGTTTIAGKDDSVYLGTDGISCGTKFKVTKDGHIEAKAGKIGKFEIIEGALCINSMNDEDIPAIMITTTHTAQSGDGSGEPVGTWLSDHMADMGPGHVGVTYRGQNSVHDALLLPDGLKLTITGSNGDSQYSEYYNTHCTVKGVLKADDIISYGMLAVSGGTTLSGILTANSRIDAKAGLNVTGDISTTGSITIGSYIKVSSYIYLPNDMSIRGLKSGQTTANTTNSNVIGYIASNNRLILGSESNSDITEVRSSGAVVIKSNGATSDTDNTVVRLGSVTNDGVTYGYFRPGTDGMVYLGGTSYQWKQVYAKVLKSSGNGIIEGDLSVSGQITIDNPDTTTNSTTTSDTYPMLKWSSSTKKILRYQKSSSSRRYKCNIFEGYTDESLNPENLYKVPLFQYQYNPGHLDADDQRVGMNLYGFIVEELVKYYPSAVDINSKGQPEDWNTNFLLPAMLKLIQNQHNDVVVLQRIVEQQTYQMSQLFDEVAKQKKIIDSFMAA